jgi:hypothetical protein
MWNNKVHYEEKIPWKNALTVELFLGALLRLAIENFVTSKY